MKQASISPLVALANFEHRVKKEESSEKRLLPKWGKNEVGFPCVLLRSFVFAATQRGRREVRENQEIGKSKEIHFYVSGPTLDQSDLDVLLGLLRKLHDSDSREKIQIRNREFLQFIGRGPNARAIGQNDLKWLKASLIRLASTELILKSELGEARAKLITEICDMQSQNITEIKLSTQFLKLYRYDYWTKLNLSFRDSVRGYPLSQWMYGFLATHDKVFDLKVETYHRLSGSAAGKKSLTLAAQRKALYGWKHDTFCPSLALLKPIFARYGYEFEWTITSTDLVKIRHQASRSQTRSLLKKN